MLVDGNGHKKALHLDSPPKRVVSLVPSLTESLFDLGFGSSVVGITDYCIHPSKQLLDLPRLGGPKNPRIDEILSLKPDLVLANQEENTRQTVEALESAGISVWVTFPKTVRQCLDMLWLLAGIYQSTLAAARVETVELTLNWVMTSASEQPKLRYFCPIWSGIFQANLRWWMTFDQNTYCHDLLSIMGGENIFSNRKRLYPLEADLGLAQPEPSEDRDVRYPRVTLSEILAGQPDIILLPNEPMEFTREDIEELRILLKDTPAVKNDRISLVDGSLITWHGTRIAHALRELPALFQWPNNPK